MTARRLTVLLSIVFLSLFLNMPLSIVADAAEDNIASYIVEVYYPSEDDNTPSEPVAGVEVSVYLVALLDENGLYQPLIPFSDFDLSDLKEMSADEIQKMSYLIVNRIAEQAIVADMTAVTLSDGIAEFDIIASYGLYITVQTSSVGEAELYSDFEPFLIQIPNYNVEQGGIHNVKAEPKLSVAKNSENIATTVTTTSTLISTQTTSVSSMTTTQTGDSEKDSDRPKTGDESKLQLWQIIFGISILGIAAILIDIIKDKRKKES